MTPRERIKSVIHFKKPDVLPWVESFYIETILKWLKQGLSAEEVAVIEWKMRGTLFFNWPALMGFDLNSYFGCQSYKSCVVPVDTGPIPRFKLRVLREDDRHTEFLTESGSVARRFRKAEHTWYNMPMFLEFPVKDRESWIEYKKRLNPKDPRRYPKDWERDAYIKVFENRQNGNTILRFNGFYGFGAQLMGIPTFNLMFYKDPELITDMGFLRKNKIDRIMMDSDGNLYPLLDLLVEAGITGLWPLEVNSGMDAISIRKKYGNKFFCAGNLDKRELAKGGEAMRKEVDAKVPLLKEMGGYIPGVDHVVHVEFTFQKFQEYARYIKKCLPY